MSFAEEEKVEPPKFTLDIKTTMVNKGEKARLFGTVIGTPRPEVLWKKVLIIILSNP